MVYALGSLPTLERQSQLRMAGLLTRQAVLSPQCLHLGDDGIRQDRLQGSFQVSDFNKT